MRLLVRDVERARARLGGDFAYHPGTIGDEAALARALVRRGLAGAALDVFEVEPLPAESPLRALENCLLAPHNANCGRAARARVHEATIANLLAALREAG